MTKGFTLIEILVTIAIIAILSAIVLFSITQYINKSKDAAIAGALSVLIPAGEVYYDHNGVNGYSDANEGPGFCDLSVSSSIVKNSFDQILSENKYCNATTNAWAACAQEFVNTNKAFCVDSRGIKREICNGSCLDSILSCPEERDLNRCPNSE